MPGTSGRYAFMLFVLHSVWSQASVRLLFSNNPVYIGKPVTLTCDYGSYSEAWYVAMDAFNGTLKEGYLYCDFVNANSTNRTGVFNGGSVTGCDSTGGEVTPVSVALTATPALELDYSCTAKVVYGDIYIVNTSGPSSLQVHVCPSSPTFQLHPIAFNDSDNGTIVCESRDGKPAALVSLSVRKNSEATWSTLNGNNSAILVLPSPLSDWHGATVMCNVTNHNCPNMSVTRNVTVNYVAMHDHPDVFYTTENDTTLNCTAYIAGYPIVRYSWTVPPEANTTSRANLSGPLFVVLRGQSGLFNCTATNDFTRRNITISFIVSNTVPTSTATATTTTPATDVGFITGILAGVILALISTAIVVVLCKRRRSPEKNELDKTASVADQQSHDVNHHGGTEASKEAPIFVNSCLTTSYELATDSHNAAVIQKPNRLLIAAEGLVGQLSQRTLNTTTVVQFCDHSSSLRDILEKVEQVLSRSSRKFQSVAFLLRPGKVGLVLSEVDHAVLTASCIESKQGESVTDFLVLLAKMCIDKSCNDARIDVLNYDGKAPIRLKNGLAALLKISATVSSDKFGVCTRTGELSGPATVAETYFDVNNLDEIVYAVLEQPSGKSQMEYHKLDEPVVYSEIKCKT